MAVRSNKGLFLFVAIAWLFGCTSKNESKEPALFDALSASATGLNFTNKLSPADSFNLFHYMYFYNGAGVGAGDFNNDSLIDLFFASNQGENKLYLNTGGLKFKDVTGNAQIPQDGGWSTGVSVADINNDGWLDIYVCRVGQFGAKHVKNQLLVCQGIGEHGVPVYKDMAAEYGLDFSGFSTQAAFLDYDLDGDLDMFLLNHAIHNNRTFRPRAAFAGTYSELSGDRLYRNDGDHFTDVTKTCGIQSTDISYGLGVAVSDINLDGYPDLYIGNDFHENDYLYINQHNGTFKEVLNDELMHTSQFSMGVDVADADNDGYPEIISMDMLPADPYILKRSLGEDEYDVFYSKIGYGYNYQYTRNNLQWNRRNGMFSETGLYSGIAATDWSWAALWMDFDNDGLKDLFISNGIPKRMNDIDYINYVSNGEVQEKIRENKLNETDMALIDKFPQIKIPNKFYHNNGNMQFADLENRIGGNPSTYSNGAVYADLDNDGDLDVVVNNIDEPALVYRNNTNTNNFAKVWLKGPANNTQAVGSKLIVFTGGSKRVYEKNAVHGFESSMEIPLLVGLNGVKVDSAVLIWPDNTFQKVNLGGNQQLTYTKGLPSFSYSEKTESTLTASDITGSLGVTITHVENPFPEFSREPLLPHKLSTEGPALAVADIDHNGLEDIFIGSSKGEKSKLYLQDAFGKFIPFTEPALSKDSMYEDVDACWVDVNNDGNVDLVIASGGNEYYGGDSMQLPRVYLNDGHAHLTRVHDAFQKIFATASCVAPYDFNGDGFVDLFIGARAVPWEYGKIPRSYLLQNDGTGKFKDVSSNELGEAGFVTNAVWADMDKDGDKDLILSLEWGAITAFVNNKGSFTKKSLGDKTGWWNFTLPVDIDGDGDLDLIAGNLGLNSKLKASDKEPVRLYYNDFDGNGKKEQVMTYYLLDKEIPFANKAELEKQMPFLKKKFLYAEDFAKSSLKNMFGSDKLSAADVFTANYFSNAVLINNGNWQFEVKALPWQAQLSSYRDAIVVNANNDNLPDILLAGNYYDNNIEMGRYDADFGTLLINKGRGQFSCESVPGMTIKGQVRHVRKITIAGKDAFVLAKNNDTTKVIRLGATTSRDNKF